MKEADIINFRWLLDAQASPSDKLKWLDYKFYVIGELFVKFLNESGDKFLVRLCTIPFYLGLCQETYHVLVRYKFIVPIEKLSDTEKRELYNESKKYCDKKENLVKACRALHAVGSMINLPKYKHQ